MSNLKNVSFTQLSADQIDVCATIWSKAPIWLGGDVERAKDAIDFILNRFPDTTIKPHTKALMHITLGNIELSAKRRGEAFAQFRAAERLVTIIEDEKQLVRVLAAIGFSYLAIGKDLLTSRSFLIKALSLAERVSKDQEEKIRTELKRRKISLER
ncbi:MAG: hypothetical protein HYS51_00315 [Candidatus Zambryskibacteria bacterium]|nr:hypothetical protein [Candidatus Zambryskibacteria bacterium]